MKPDKSDMVQGIAALLAQSPEELQPLHRMCREGHVYDVEQWITEGKPLQLAPGAESKGRQAFTAMEIALDTGQHSLTLLLLRSGYRLDLEKKSPLDTVLKKRRWDLFELLLEYGADLFSASPHAILETYSSELYERYLAAGYDFTRGHAIAAMLGYGTSNRPLYGFAKRHRSEDPKIQRELNMALCEHVREGNERGIALCLWAGADPHAEAPSLRYMRSGDDEESIGWSAIEEAVSADNLELLKRLGPDPAKDDFDDLYRSSRDSSIIQFLASISPPKNLTPILNWHIRWLGDRQFKLGGGLWTIQAVLAKGVVWRETDAHELVYTRKYLMKTGEYEFKKLMRLFSRPEICAPETYAELIRHPKMKERMLAVKLIKPHVPESQRLREERAWLSHEYDREKLYEQVWSQPVQHVAKEYGVSDVWIGKVCKILKIPKPPRGYWARIRSGQKVRKPSLPTLKLEMPREQSQKT